MYYNNEIRITFFIFMVIVRFLNTNHVFKKITTRKHQVPFKMPKVHVELVYKRSLIQYRMTTA